MERWIGWSIGDNTRWVVQHGTDLSQYAMATTDDHIWVQWAHNLSLSARVNVGCFDMSDFGSERIRGPGVSCKKSSKGDDDGQSVFLFRPRPGGNGEIKKKRERALRQRERECRSGQSSPRPRRWETYCAGLLSP